MTDEKGALIEVLEVLDATNRSEQSMNMVDSAHEKLKAYIDEVNVLSGTAKLVSQMGCAGIVENNILAAHLLSGTKGGDRIQIRARREGEENDRG